MGVGHKLGCQRLRELRAACLWAARTLPMEGTRNQDYATVLFRKFGSSQIAGLIDPLYRQSSIAMDLGAEIDNPYEKEGLYAL
jgi:hypothetical protein